MNGSEPDLAPFGIAFGIFFVIWALMLVVGIALTVWWIFVIVEVVKIPDHQYRAAGTEKTTWVLIVVLVGALGAIIWYLAKRQEVQAMAGVPPPVAVSPPGWYPDAYGVTRWWDGARWTEHHQ